MLPNENKKLDRALDGNEINMEQLRQDYPELYKEIKNSLPAWMQHPDKMPKSMKASDIFSTTRTKVVQEWIDATRP